MPESQGAVRLLDADRLERMLAGLYVAAGVSTEDARIGANALVDADLRGVHTHGARLIPNYLKGIRTGSLNAKASLTAVRDDGTTALFDAERGIGHVAGAKAMRLAIQRALELGTCTVGVRSTGHTGAMAYYTQMAADAGCIGYANTNGGIVMIPPGGRDKAVGLNPLSWAVPTDRPWAINLDMATSVVAGGKLVVAQEQGKPIPLGWALDPQGNPTTDPKLGMEGGMLPLGGPKGYGLAVILDVLCGVLTGGRFGKALGGSGSGLMLQAISIERFMPLCEFRERMKELVDQLKAGGLAPGSDGIYFPGELEYNLKQQRLRDGIPYHEVNLADLRREAETAGIPYDIEIG
jgi:LDH2 family malate/lactate/ureidoglycolate dehydrogenase